MRSVSAGLQTYLDSTTADRSYRHILTVTPRTGSVVRWTDYFQDLVVGGNTYRAGGEGTTYPKVEVGKRHDKPGVEIGNLAVTLHCGKDAVVNGLRVPLATLSRYFDGSIVKVERLYPDPAGGWFDPMHLFEGPVGKAEPRADTVRLEIESGMALLRRPMPPRVYKAPCTFEVYDAGCTLAKASFTSTFTVKSAPAPAVTGFSFDTGTLSTDPGRVAGYYRLGVVKFTSGALNGVERGVRVYTWAANVGAVTFDRPVGVAPATGDTFTIYPRCTRTLAVCENADIAVGPAFDNRVHFGGMPFVPKNESAIPYRTAPTLGPPPGYEPIKPGADVTQESSVYNRAIPIIWGQAKIGANLLYRAAWTIPGYYLVQAGLCEGVITGVARVWRDQDVATSPAEQNLTVFTGTRPTQTAWAALPAAKSLGYPGLAHIDGIIGLAGDDPLGMKFEVKGLRWNTGGSAGDAHPADVILDFLSDAAIGAGIASSAVVTDVGQDGTADSSLRRYVTASGFWLSPVLAEQREAREWLRLLLDCVNADVIWSDGKFKFVPLGGESVTGNSVTYTPVTTIRYEISDSDLLGDSLEAELPPETDTYNLCPVEFLERDPASATGDRSNAYNPATVDDADPVDIATRGERAADVVALHPICLRDVALKISRIRAQRQIRARARFTVDIGWRFARLEPYDYIRLKSARFGLTQDVRILEIEEDPETGALSLTVEEWEEGTGAAVEHVTQSNEAPPSQVAVYDTEARLHEIMAGNLAPMTMPTGSYHAVLWLGGTSWVAVGASVAAYTLDDGAIWTASTGLPAGTYYGVAQDPATSTIIAVGASVCARSTDGGATFAAQTIPAGTYRSVTWALGLSLFVAVGDSNACATSPTGVTWTGQTIATGSYMSVTWAEDLALLCAVGLSGVIATSTNATAWTARTSGTASTLRAVARGSGAFAAVGAVGRLSVDGITWSAAASIVWGGSYEMYGISWTGKIWVAVGGRSPAPPIDPAIAIARDGSAWQKRFSPNGAGAEPTAVASSGKRLLLVGGAFGQYGAASLTV